MATDNTKLMIGPGIVSVGDYVAEGVAGTLVDVGHTSEPIEMPFGFENADLEGERAQGIIDTKPIKQEQSIIIPMLEVTPARMLWALGQPAANLTGGVLLIGDRAKRFHQVTVLQNESLDTDYTSLTVTLWKCQVSQIDPVRMAKGEWTVIKVTMRVIRDDSVTTLDKYGKYVWA